MTAKWMREPDLNPLVRQGLELAALEILRRSDKLTPVSTGTLRRSNRYEVINNSTVHLISGGDKQNLPMQSNLSDYVAAQYYGKYRHAGDFTSGLKSFMQNYTGDIASGYKYRTRYNLTYRLAVKDGYLQIQPSAPQWFETAYRLYKAKILKVFSGAFK